MGRPLVAALLAAVNAGPPGNGVVADCVTTSAKVAATAGVLALFLGCLAAEGLSHSGSSGAPSPQLDQTLDSIWSGH
jgi:hypothetical protein